MALAPYKVRIVANACISRYDSGEGPMAEIIASYNLSTEDETLVKAQIIAFRPDIVI